MEIAATILAGFVIFVIVLINFIEWLRWKKWVKGSYPKDEN